VRALLSYVMRGRMEAITASSVCATLSLLVPPVSYLSGALAGLATLRQGLAEGGVVVAGSALLTGALTWLVTGSPYPVVVFVLMTWLPIWVLGAVLRGTASQGAALAVAGALGALVLLGIHVVIADPAAWWRELLGEAIGGALQSGGMLQEGAAMQRLSAVLDAWAPVMTGVLGAAVVLGFVVTLLLARWWHAVLDNPGGFGREFRALRLDPRLTLGVAAVAALALVANDLTGGLAADLLGPALVLYMFQGLAVAHALVAGRNASMWWLVALYVLLGLIPPHMALLLALVGVSDTWLDYRARWT